MRQQEQEDSPHELVGRPGLNPLRFQTRYHVDQAHYEMAQELVKVTKVNAMKEFSIKNGYSNPFEEGTLPFGSAGTFCLDDKNWIRECSECRRHEAYH